MQRDVQFFHGEAVVDFEGEMVEEHCFVSLKKEPVLYLSDDVFLTFSFLVLLGDGLVDVLLFGLVGITRMHDRYLLVLDVVGEFQLLDDLLVLKVNLVHFG